MKELKWYGEWEREFPKKVKKHNSRGLRALEFVRDSGVKVEGVVEYCAARVIRDQGGAVTAYDGDRIMAVYVGDNKNTAAAKTAMKINYAVRQIINPALAAQYPTGNYVVRQVVGIDASDLFVARTGIRGANDLVWVGPAANYAAKICSIRGDFSSWITEKVYSMLADEAKLTKGQNMWEKRSWKEMNNMTVYGSSWTWKV